MRTTLRIIATLLAFFVSLPIALVVSVMAHVIIHGSAAQVPPKLVMPYELIVVLAPLLFGIWGGRLASTLAGFATIVGVYFIFKLGAYAMLLRSELAYLAYGEPITVIGMVAAIAIGAYVMRRYLAPQAAANR